MTIWLRLKEELNDTYAAVLMLGRAWSRRLDDRELARA